ncbi:helix-turn-helix domain-containing protein [Pigmentiphaga humi]|uniref:helix-turn-helix domain-containing protein n=1 Tax=Pigmentiphaga humi TaxID=2478468 RepID=UPI000F54529B|nr:helix-turn-helix domain-containing protein [Pigmentiphaga humi]
MDEPIVAAARALAAGDPLDALNRIALRDDADALALRGIAMAQLGELGRARTLVRRAARAFGQRSPVARARCVVAEAEIALAARELDWPTQALEAARTLLEARGDRHNAAHARLLEARHALLLGRLDTAERALASLDASIAFLRPAARAAHAMAEAGVAVRRVRAAAARAALARARQAAQSAGIPALEAEIGLAARHLDLPAARLIARGGEQPLLLDEVEALQASAMLVIDACRHVVRAGRLSVPLARRPVLFELARALGLAWPEDVPRADLIARVFRTRHPDETHRARLRVEMGRLRAALEPIAGVRATSRGFLLAPARPGEVGVLEHPAREPHAHVLALLADGQPWSSSAMALALGSSQRTVQRALDALGREGKVQAFGQGRARRWAASPLPGFATSLLLPPPLPADLG